MADEVEILHFLSHCNWSAMHGTKLHFGFVISPKGWLILTSKTDSLMSNFIFACCTVQVTFIFFRVISDVEIHETINITKKKLKILETARETKPPPCISFVLFFSFLFLDYMKVRTSEVILLTCWCSILLYHPVTR